jgi:hypothetical protein
MPRLPEKFRQGRGVQVGVLSSKMQNTDNDYFLTVGTASTMINHFHAFFAGEDLV